MLEGRWLEKANGEIEIEILKIRIADIETRIDRLLATMRCAVIAFQCGHPDAAMEHICAELADVKIAPTGGDNA